jgi:putative spermidine/putrescine transport system substrate-binding protein
MNTNDGMTRRKLVSRAAAAGIVLPGLGGLLAACGGGDGGASTATSGGGGGGAKRVNFSTYGGTYFDHIKKNYADSFEAKSGVKVNLGEGASLSQLKLQVQAGKVQWDIVELTAPEYEIAVKENLLEPLDYNVINAEAMPEFARKEFGIKFVLFLFGMGWDQRKIPDAEAPKTWAEFWDTRRYDTKRSIAALVADCSALEAALLADGVDPKALYPLDVDRALASMKKLGKNGMVFYESNSDPIQQLSSGELSLAMTYSGRILTAQQDGAKVNFSPNHGFVSGDFLGITKGSPNKAATMEFLNHVASDAKSAAGFMVDTTYAHPSTEAAKLLKPEVAATLPTSPELKDKVIIRDDAWWAENLEQVQTKYKEWQLSL